MLYDHQMDMVAHALMTRNFIWGAEMGTGKTLAAFIYMAMSGITDFIWVAPLSALRAYNEEIIKWDHIVNPVTMTYDGLKKYVLRGVSMPQGIIFDESAKIKTPTSQRSVAARNLSNELRSLDQVCSIGLLSGAPAPRSPVDWWHQCEVACPGYLREGNVFLFRERLGIFEDADNGNYKKHVAWRDTESKCAECGQLESDPCHAGGGILDHQFAPGKDEVSFLYKRMKGLVLIKLKKDCLDLPDKTYERRILKPSRDTILAAKLVADTSTRTIEALTKLRMLSDGFQYTEKEDGDTVCPLCIGKMKYVEYFDPDDPLEYVPTEWVDQGIKYIYDDDGGVVETKQVKYEKRYVECTNCNGTGRVTKYIRDTTWVECPKTDALLEDLDAHEEVGRLVVYCGFTGSIERVISICQKHAWTTIRADGHKWEGRTPYGEILDNDSLINIFQEQQEKYPKVVFIGQPGAAGEGLTLTASPTIIYWSNDFNGNSRMQSEDRGHRIGMMDQGGRIVDYIHLPSDLYVLDNLQQKKNLQRQSMTGIKACFEGVKE